jgi:ubiquinone/menaquinone biosynthesis C-methylase UbiE
MGNNNAMNETIATQRASMPIGATRVLDRRTLEAGNKNLLALIAPGQSVLDVGCGSGSITKGIAERTTKGYVVGIDMSAELIQIAKERYSSIENLTFIETNVMDFKPALKFDLITSARTLQWMSNYKEALLKMKSMLSSGGCLAVLDYNHEKIEWYPPAPESLMIFYGAFLRWRADAGMNNAIADDLRECFADLGLIDIADTDESEIILKSDPDFHEAAGIWKVVAETRGKQMVRDGYLSEEDRLLAISDYNLWLEHEGESMKMYLRGTFGYDQKN